MQADVTRDPSVQLGNAQADRPRPLLLIAIAIGTFVAGLGVARGLARTERERMQASVRMSSVKAPRAPAAHAPEVSASVAPAQAVNALPAPAPRAVVARDPIGVDAGISAHARAVVSTIAQVPKARAPQPQAPPVQAPQPHAPQPLADARVESPAGERGAVAFKRIFVAYVRCDGLPQVAGRFPCPRDPWLETHVWRALSELTQCNTMATQRGEGELRLDFDRYGAVSLRFEPKGGGGLDPRAVLQCAEPSLARVHTSLRPERMLVSFRFELR